MSDEKNTRAFDTTIDIDASPDAVWDALSKAEELVCWFPLNARVEPGAGGQMTWAWAMHGAARCASRRGSRRGCCVWWTTARVPTTSRGARCPRAR